MERVISRRQFLAGAAAFGATTVLTRPIGALFGVPVAGAAESLAKSNGERTLVLCTLYGGNDGLNMVVPYSDPVYHSVRANIAVDPSTVLPLSKDIGLNPALPGMKSMWDAGRLAIVRGVGYPDASLSHFQSMAIWQTASPSGELATGWLGRWLDRTNGDPLRACSVGPTVLPAMFGDRRKAVAVQDTTSGGGQLPYVSHELLAVYRELQHPYPGMSGVENDVAVAGHEMLSSSRTFARALDHEPPPTLPEGVDDGDIGTQLDIVSSLIRAGIPGKAYAVTQGGFDTHTDEVGTQSELLGQLDTAITAFFQSIAGHPAASGTTLVIHSEFGRRVNSNASNGTDHGTANDVLVIGPSVVGGFYGDPPSLTDLDENGNLKFEIDFRSVYATLLERVIGVDPGSFLGKRFPLLGFV
jgi:uncharacterized protein (DUF1501 family)